MGQLLNTAESPFLGEKILDWSLLGRFELLFDSFGQVPRLSDQRTINTQTELQATARSTAVCNQQLTQPIVEFEQLSQSPSLGEPLRLLYCWRQEALQAL